MAKYLLTSLYDYPEYIEKARKLGADFVIRGNVEDLKKLTGKYSNILIFDVVPGYMEQTAGLLKRRGRRIAPFTDQESALEYYRRNEISLVIAGVGYQLQGFRFIEQIKRIDSEKS